MGLEDDRDRMGMVMGADRFRVQHIVREFAGLEDCVGHCRPDYPRGAARHHVQARVGNFWNNRVGVLDHGLGDVRNPQLCGGAALFSRGFQWVVASVPNDFWQKLWGA
jgi:hypothetical protein